MATADSKRMYSWWWDSHISPKNSKWLQENLADMDSKVKQMIKLIEEDADSFARRAEMFYKKRPELMKLVEEFYRTYRALAERYDHATGVIHQANRTMAEVFPNNQLPFVLSDESPSGLTGDADPHTPETTPPIRAFFDSDEIQKNVLGLSSHFHAVKRSGSLTEEPVFVMNRKGLKQLNDLFGYGEGIVHGKSVEVKVKKVLNFHDMEDKNQSSQKNGALSESDRVDKAETELLDLKEALAKLEAEKEASLLQRQLSMERLFNVESEVSHAQEDYQGLKDRASKAEAEVQNIKEVLTKLQADSKAGLFKYQQCLDKMSHLENKIFSTQKDAGDLNERAEKAETEVESLKQDLARNGAEKEAALIQYNQSLEMISNLECKLVQAEEEAKRISERADKAECEVELLKEEVIKLIEEKEAAAVSYQQCLETISQLEQKLASAQEKSERLNSMIEDEIAKFKGAEGRCELLLKSNQTLQSELECYVLRVGSQGEELAEKQKELNRLWTSVQEERMRFLETETAFQTLQHLHSQSQKELRSLVAELQDRAKLLNDMETHSGGLEDEVQKVKEETKSLNEINLSSALSIENLKDEISNLKETIRKLEEEVGLRVDQRNAIQQELYCLKEELNDLNKKHSIMLEQVESVGFNPENFGSSVKELQDECSELKQTCEANTGEKDLLEKLAVMEKLQDKNALLENSLADLNVELKDVRKNLLALEESYHSLLEEKSVLIAENTSLICQLQTATANMEKLAEKSKFLESSLFDANNELEGLRITSRNLENSDLLLNNEKLGLIADKENLVFQLDITQQKVEDFGNRYTELEKKLSGLEKERESALHMAEGLHVSLDAKKQEHASFAQLSETKLAYMDLQVRHLQEEVQRKKKEYEKEQDKALNAHFEILILQKFIQDLEGRSFSILIEHQKLLDASKMSHKLISELEHENIDRQAEIKSLYEQNKLQRMELYLVLKALGIDENHECPSKMEEDQKILKHVLMKLKELKDALMRNCDENDQLIIENSVILTLLGQLELEGVSIMEERDKSDLEFRIQFDKFVALQGETQRLVQMNEKFRLKAIEGDERDKVLTSKLDDLQRQLLELQGAYKNLQQENHKVLGEKSSLNKKVLKLEKDKCYLEEENIVIFGEKIFQSNLSLIFKDIIVKTSLQLEELNDGYNIIHLINVDLKKKVRVLEEKLHDYQMENLHLKESMSKLGNELIMAKSVNHRLNNEMTDAKSLLSQKQNEIQLLDRQAVAVIGELLISSVCKEVLEGKILELAKSFQSLKTQNNCKDMEIELLKEKEIKFQDENVGLETQLAAHVSGVISLNDYITSLEKQTLTHTISHKFDNKESQDHQVTLQVENVQTVAVVPDGISVLQELQTRLRDIEHAVMEKERLMILENLNANAKLDCLMKEIEVLKAGNNSGKENGRTNKLIHKNEKSAEVGNEIRNNTKLKSNTYEISDSGSEVLTKDIMLDQESESSSYEISKRVTAGAEDHMLELWESTDHDSSIDLMVSNTQKVAVAPPDLFDVKAVKEHKNRYYYMESLVEKELGVDKLEISKRFASARNEGNKRKILERLDSDVQKLTNLQITVHDLKRKVEVTEKSKRGKDIEYDSVKEQLEEAEESITKLFEGNRKLMKSIEGGGSISHEGMSRVVLDESGSSIRRRRISEQARKGSEKIGCLQLEVQKLQFLLMKLDDEKGSRRRTRITEHKPSVLLKDYIYGVRVRTGKKPKRATFCGCVQLPTMGG